MSKSARSVALERIEHAQREGAMELNLSGLSLRDLPPETGTLTTLRTLHIDENQLTSLPPEIGALTALESLYVNGNQLRSLPPEIGALTALESLFAYHNQLTSLPREIGALTALRRLSLGENQLVSLPSEIGALTNLRALYVGANQITSLPPQIVALTKLETLNLAENRLTSLLPELQSLTRLRRLFLHNNPALKLSPAVLGPHPRGATDRDRFPSARSILDVYFGRTSGRARPLNEVKIILVGRGGAGKTSIVRALRGEPFRDGQRSTPGIALCDLAMMACKKGPVTAHVWDFAGQVITHALHRFFFSVRTVYILVLTGRENSEREDAEYWLRLIKAFGSEGGGEGPPVIVALNKWNVKGCRPRLDTGAIKERYPFIREFIPLDCKSEHGVPKLLSTLHKQVDRLDWVREPFKESWDDVRRVLTRGKKSRAHVTYGEYRKLCAEHGVGDEREQDSLAEILHNLGSALNYRHDPRLKEATVLKPEWLTKNVYKLMRRAEKQSGVLKQADVDAALAAEPDEEMRKYLVRLMERFEIAYGAKGEAVMWLVPQALPDVQPAGAEEFATAADATRLRYTYPALPEGLVAKAIVRLHEFIEEAKGKKRQWASGAILTREGARALVRTEPQDRRVMITVTGDAAARRRLAGLCQAEMRDIHAEIPGLTPIEETLIEGTWFPTATLEADERKGGRSGVPTSDRGTVAVDPSGANNAFSQPAARSEETWKPSIFICYSKANVNQRKRLELELKVLMNEGKLAGHWHDRMIDPGDPWDDTIMQHLEEADVFVMLASTPALATDYITNKEIPAAIAMHEKRDIVVVPVVLEKCRWTQTRLGAVQALPEKGRPVNSWGRLDEAWSSVADGIAAVCEKLMRERPPGASGAGRRRVRGVGAFAAEG